MFPGIGVRGGGAGSSTAAFGVKVGPSCMQDRQLDARLKPLRMGCCISAESLVWRSQVCSSGRSFDVAVADDGGRLGASLARSERVAGSLAVLRIRVFEGHWVAVS